MNNLSPTQIFLATLMTLSFAFPLALAPAQENGGSAPESDEASPLNGLGQSQLQEVFQVLNRHYIEKENLTYDELNKAALDGLLRRLSFGATLVPKNGEPDPTDGRFPFHQEIINDSVAYLRPVHFTEEEIEKTTQALKSYPKKKIDTLILDLRAPVVENEFARAAAFLDLFTDSGVLLFKIKKPTEQRGQLFLSKRDNLWNGRLLILVDRETSSAAETVAAVLDHYVESLIIGEPTPGRTVQYQEVALDGKHALRFASAEVLLPDDRSLFRKGVTPQVRAVTPKKNKRKVFEQSVTKGLPRYLFDRERPRMNEAALVASEDPELDYYLARSAGATTPYDRTPLQDGVIQQAMEMLLTADFLTWKPKPAPADKMEETEDDKATEEPPGKGVKESPKKEEEQPTGKKPASPAKPEKMEQLGTSD